MNCTHSLRHFSAPSHYLSILSPFALSLLAPFLLLRTLSLSCVCGLLVLTICCCFNPFLPLLFVTILVQRREKAMPTLSPHLHRGSPALLPQYTQQPSPSPLYLVDARNNDGFLRIVLCLVMSCSASSSLSSQMRSALLVGFSCVCWCVCHKK